MLIQHSDVEGDMKILSITPLKLIPKRKFFGYCLNILTIFIFSLICRWYLRLKLMFYYTQESEINYATHLLIVDCHGIMEIHKLKRTDKQLHFIYRHLEYYYKEQFFQPLDCPLNGCNMKFNPIPTLSQNDLYRLNQLYGSCELIVPIPTVFNYFEKELTSPLYFTQYVSITIWLLEGYIQLALITPVLAILSSLVNYVILRKAMQQLQLKAKHNQQITVYRDSQEYTIDSTQLVPGDILQLYSNQIAPCDALLIQGDLLVDEQTLTGESIPINKESIAECSSFSIQKYKQNIIFDGTKVLNVKNDVRVVVLRTGYLSYKGQIFRNALYPKPPKIIFFYDVVKFLIIVAIAVIALYFSLLWKMVALDYDPTLIALRLGDAIVWIIPPNLVTIVNLAISVALQRLKGQGIYGTQPEKNLESSQTDIVCFDKTGTLTTNIISVKECYQFDKQSNSLIQGINPQLEMIMGTCHQAYLINDELLGDTLDIAMIQYSGYELSNEGDCKFIASKGDVVIRVLRLFEFASDLQRMGCVVNNQDNTYNFYCKGSMEKIRELCSNQIFPKEVQELVETMSLKGFRIIGLASKIISHNEVRQSRQELEQNLSLCGVILFENELKEDTKQYIEQLQSAELKIKIISGDHILSTVNCGYECSILKLNTAVLDYEGGELKIYELIDGIKTELTMDQADISEKLVLPNSNYVTTAYQQFHIGMSGSAFEYFKSKPYFNDLISKTSIFGRMSPLQKSEVVRSLQECHHHVAMIGDGSNDCHALKQANIGISFQNADAASTASFSTVGESIGCVVKVLLQGKATSANVLEVFKYYMIINVSKYVSAQLMMYQMQNFNNEDLLYLNYFSNAPILALLAVTGPSKYLTKHKINTSMMELNNFVTTIIILILSGLDMLASYLHLYFQPWYQSYDNDPTETKYLFKGDQNTQQFINMNLYFLLSFFAINTYYPFKASFTNQKHIIIPIIIFTIIAMQIYFVPLSFMDDYLQFTSIKSKTLFEFQQWIINVSISIVVIIIGRVSWVSIYTK